MSYNLDMDTVMAQNWKREVDSELDAVNELLKKVSMVCQEIPGEEDTVMQGIYKVGTELSNTWTNLGNTFKEVQNQYDALLKVFADAGKKSAEIVNNYMGKIGY